jgi:hypothetical protein
MEADALSSRSGRSSSAVSFASGMISAHRGELEEAFESFHEARALAREHGERLMEFCAVEHWVMLQIDQQMTADARSLSKELEELGGRVRPGVEAPAGRALHALSRLASGDLEAEGPLLSAIEELRTIDAKYELSFLLTRWARHALGAGDPEAAAAHATDALEVATAIGRPSEVALASALLVECAKALDDREAHAKHEEALRASSLDDLSSVAREEVRRALTDPD